MHLDLSRITAYVSFNYHQSTISFESYVSSNKCPLVTYRVTTFIHSRIYRGS